MLGFKETHLAASQVRSLQWTNEGLTDWVSGGTLYRLDGTIREGGMDIAHPFDSALVSPSGRFAVVYEKLGSKGVVLESNRVVREISRNSHIADCYEYPVALFTLPDGDEALVHCPDDTDCLEVERLSTGERLTRSEMRTPQDFYCSRLAVNVSNTLLVDTGWAWHPYFTVSIYNLAGSLERPQFLDEMEELSPDLKIELNNAIFFGDLLMLTVSSQPIDFDEPDKRFKANTLGIYDVYTQTWTSIHTLETPIGLFFPLNLRYIVSFYDHPKVIDLYTGKVVQGWEHIKTGTQELCVTDRDELAPPLAMDSKNARFAVWHDDQITVVQFDRAELAAQAQTSPTKDTL
jgi:hypothetical protein